MIAHMLIDSAAAVLAAPSPSTGPGEIAPVGLNFGGVKDFLIWGVAPVLFAVIGLFFIARSFRGEVGKVLTSSTIAIIGAVFLVGGAGMLGFGLFASDLLFKK